jgi:hypothetical protein
MAEGVFINKVTVEFVSHTDEDKESDLKAEVVLGDRNQAYALISADKFIVEEEYLSQVGGFVAQLTEAVDEFNE